MGFWYAVAVFEEENLVPFDTWMHCGANELDGMIWSGILKCISDNRIFRQCVMTSHRMTRDSLLASVFIGIE